MLNAHRTPTPRLAGGQKEITKSTSAVSEASDPSCESEASNRAYGQMRYNCQLSGFFWRSGWRVV